VWHIAWEFRVAHEQRARFEELYRGDGEWARLFARSSEFRGTMLWRDPDNPGRYVTVDTWRDAGAFARFHEAFAAEYHALDARCEALTESEIRLGGFELVGPGHGV
jgi:hypothetical protein